MYKREALLFEHTYSSIEKALFSTFASFDSDGGQTKNIHLKKLFISQNIFITAMKTGNAAVNDMADLHNLRSLFSQCSPGISMTDALKEQSIVLH